MLSSETFKKGAVLGDYEWLRCDEDPPEPEPEPPIIVGPDDTDWYERGK